MTAMGPAAVYLLCLLTSAVCAVLLMRAYFRSRARLLLWTGLSFVCLAVNNLVLVADLVFLPQIDLWIWRQAAAAAAIGILLYAFIWEAER